MIIGNQQYICLQFCWSWLKGWDHFQKREDSRKKKKGIPSWVMVLKLSKKVHFLQFCADLSQKPKCVKVIYIYGSESSHYSLSENDMAYRGRSHRLWDIRNWNIKKVCQNPNIRSKNLCCSGLFWTSFSFLQVNQQKRVGMVSTNNV